MKAEIRTAISDHRFQVETRALNTRYTQFQKALVEFAEQWGEDIENPSAELGQVADAGAAFEVALRAWHKSIRDAQ